MNRKTIEERQTESIGDKTMKTILTGCTRNRAAISGGRALVEAEDVEAVEAVAAVEAEDEPRSESKKSSSSAGISSCTTTLLGSTPLVSSSSFEAAAKSNALGEKSEK
jgi:hypothetical protein